ncbi:cupin domain-containing protein [Sphingomicrobium sediminis]|uniref:Cupin domain-containing protein n=1 Tax=Sphingomicrobium sediminis TaxID=2950949 RepID=A0A9X2EEV0_9SPHN|nr:cupin domain-containing protein [Sphingomicrobium sediminis]MCM8556665.1 cupin domain-containing protein [Sphingomicrobium sediminis]
MLIVSIFLITISLHSAVTIHPQSESAISIDALQWQEMVPGVAFAPTHGDWNEGAHGKYVSIVKDAVVPMHTHSAGYHAVFISGKMTNLYSDGGRLHLSPGDYFQIDAMQPHAHDCTSDEPCVFYTYSDQAWDIQIKE